MIQSMGGFCMYLSKKRIVFAASCIVIGYTVLAAKLAASMCRSSEQTALYQRQFTITAGRAEGTIYDRNFQPLANGKTVFRAVVKPVQTAQAEVLPHVLDVGEFIEGVRSCEPFVCTVDTECFQSPDIFAFSVSGQADDTLYAPHVIGYTVDGKGVTGLEGDYDAVLRGEQDAASVTFTVDALGNVLNGIPAQVQLPQGKNSGVVTSLDRRIQQICEEKGSVLEKGAVVVMEVQTGDILGMASFPTFSPEHLEDALASEDSPLINRCLYSYSVGSIFKLVTCAAAYEQGLTAYKTICKGSISVKEQIFHCHQLEGHGMMDMKHAMITSCNCYFIALSKMLKPEVMRETAQKFGFGTQIVLSADIASASGVLPTPEELELPAERANFSFGQGFLTASPLQVTQMTCGIANNGDMPLARLILGYTTDGCTTANPKPVMYAKSIRREAAYYLQDMMTAAVNESETSNARPRNVYAAAKTSTAQTGRFDAQGEEYCHGWITGYFPAENPRYAVTVLAEDGGYGNDAAAPVFREIAEAIMDEEIQGGIS